MQDIDVFISYKREERSLADQVARALKNAGYVAVTDLNIQKATDFGEAIDRMIREAKVVLVLWTTASAASKWVRTEAIEGHAQGKYLGVRIDPVSADALPIEVRRNNWLDLSDAPLPQGLPDLLGEVQRLAGISNKDAAAAETAAQSAEKDLEFYQVVSEIGDIGGFRKYLQLYPNGTYVEDARSHIRRGTGLRAVFRAVPVFSIITAIGTGVGAYVALSGTRDTSVPPQTTAMPSSQTQDVANLIKKLDAAEAEKNRLEQARTTMESRIDQYSDEIDTLKEQIESTTEALTKSESGKKVVEAELIDVRAQLESALKEKNLQNTEGAAERLNEQIEVLKNQLNSALINDASKEVQLQSLSEQLNTELARVARLEREKRLLEEASRAQVEDRAIDTRDAIEVIAPDDIRKVQSQLSRLGFYRFPIDGNWGDGSSSALKQAQAKLGLARTGDVLDGIKILDELSNLPGPIRCTVRNGLFPEELRREPSPLSPKIADIPPGKSYQVLDQAEGSGTFWFQIQVGSRTGWMRDFGDLTASGEGCRQ